MTEKRFKSRCYEKQKNVVIYDKGDKLFDVSYRDFEDAYYLKMKLSPVIDKLNELSEENSKLHTQNDFLNNENQHMRDLVNENKQLKDDVYDWKVSAEDYLKLGKSLKKENEQLKTQLQNTCDQRDEFHRGARENANRVGQLEKENKELKLNNEKLIEMVQGYQKWSAKRSEFL